MISIVVVMERETDRFQIVGRLQTPSGFSLGLNRRIDECEHQRRGEAAETDAGDRHPAALKPAVAPANPDERNDSQHDRRQPCEIRTENRADSQHPADVGQVAECDRPASGRRLLFATRRSFLRSAGTDGKRQRLPQVGRRLLEVAGEVVLVGDDLRNAELLTATGALATQTCPGRALRDAILRSAAGTPHDNRHQEAPRIRTLQTHKENSQEPDIPQLDFGWTLRHAADDESTAVGSVDQ